MGEADLNGVEQELKAVVQVPERRRGRPKKFATDEERLESTRASKRAWRKEHKDQLRIYMQTYNALKNAKHANAAQ